jgi:septation ring formation regulator EzrA
MVEAQANGTVSLAPLEVIGRLQEQADLYARLEDLASRQRGLITSDRPEQLLAILAQRRQITSRLQVLGMELKPVATDWSAFRTRCSEVERARADELVEEVQRRLRSVMSADEQDAKLLAARKATTAGALQQTQANRQALAAYGGPGGKAARRPRLSDEG